MPIVPVRDMVGGGGVNRDVAPNDLPPNAWSNIINGRFSRKRIERFGGDELYQNAVSDIELTNAQVIYPIIRNGAEGFLMINDTDIFIDIGAGWQSFTPVAPIVSSDQWLMEQYGDWLILTTVDGGQEPLVLNPTGVLFIPFTNWRAGYQCIKIFPYKNFLIGVGVEINNNEQNGLVIWSDVVNESILADVAWDPFDPTTLAGENVLPSADGLIRDGGVLRDSGILYTDTSVWRMDASNAVAGVTPLVFNFRKIFDDDGILRQRCFTEVNGKHYVVGVYDIYLHDGFNKASISDNRMTEFFYSRLGTGNFAFMTHYQRPQEIIISYSAQDNTAATEAIIYNYFYNTFTRFIPGPSSSGYTHLILGPEFLQLVQTWQDFQNQGLTWADLNNTTWDSLFPQARNRIPFVLVPGSNSLFFIDRNTTTATASDMLLEKLDMGMEVFFPEVATRSLKYLKRFIPQIKGDGAVTIQFGYRNSLGEPIVWQPEREYNLLTDYKFDLRITGRYISMRIRQAAQGNAAELTGYDLEVKPVSFR